MFDIPEITLPHQSLTGLECPLSAEETAIQDNIHRFAAEVVRPTGIALDKLSAEDAIAPDSPL